MGPFLKKHVFWGKVWTFDGNSGFFNGKIRIFDENIHIFDEKITVFDRLLSKRRDTETGSAPRETLEKIVAQVINDIEMGFRGADFFGGGQVFSAVSGKSRWEF